MKIRPNLAAPKVGDKIQFLLTKSIYIIESISLKGEWTLQCDGSWSGFNRAVIEHAIEQGVAKFIK